MKKEMKYFAVAATCVLAACAQKEMQVEAPAVKTSQILAYGGEITKANINNNAEFSWKAGDQIAVYAGTGYKISDALASDGTSSATFTFSGEEVVDDAQRANFALYPASLACDEFGDKLSTNFAADNLDITLPKAYDLSDITGQNSPVFMVAANTPGNALEFKQLGALLRFKLVSVPKQTQYITFDFNGKKVCGSYTLSSVAAGTTAIVAENTTGDDDVITVYNDVFTTFQTGLIVNIPVPTGTYTDVTITTWDGEPDNGGHKINALTTPVDASNAAWTAGRKDARKRIAYLPVFTIDGNVGIGNGKKAVFAPGNLQAILESSEPYEVSAAGNNKLFAAQSWKFANHQYEALGAKTPHDVNASDERNSNSINSLQDPKAGDAIDLFAWTGAQASYWSTERPEKVKYGLFVTTNGNGTSTYLGNTADELLLSDWGHNIISDEIGEYPADTWRTPTKTEWDRVIQGRKDPNNDNNLIAHGAKGKIVKSKSDPTVVAYGLILLPDMFTYPSGVPVLVKVAGTDAKSGSGGTAVAKYDASAGATCDDNSYTVEEWEKMEAAGCVFLPLTNHRHFATTPYNGEGLYWIKNIQSGKSNNWTLAFNFIKDGYTASLPSSSSNMLQSGKTTTRHYGCAVRLVRQVN